jgi:hypothetical protein
MEAAAEHLPANSARPAVIFFTDGRHEVAGVPVGQVVPARDRLFGDRSPFALLPVGMGLDPADRPTLEAGLESLRVSRDFERCEGGPLEWPTVVFESADAAGQAVGVALQDVSCTFTVEPTPTPVPTATPVPPATVGNLDPEAGDGSITLTWTPPADADANPVVDYQVRCTPATGGDAIESSEGESTETTATVEGLANGVEYSCEVVAVRASGPDPEGVAEAMTPFGPPPAPAKPTVAVGDRSAQLNVAMPAGAPVTQFLYECSSDGGATWPVEGSASGRQPSFDVTTLANGTEYVCRVSAANENGTSEASPLTDAFRPCSGLIDCNPIVLPLFGALLALLVAAALLAVYRRYRGRQVYVTVQVDGFSSVSLGRGPTVRMRFIRQGSYNRVTGIAPADAREADVRIRYAGGEKFEIRSKRTRTKAEFGRPVDVADDHGVVHSIVVRAFDEPPAPLLRTEDRIG